MVQRILRKIIYQDLDPWAKEWQIEFTLTCVRFFTLYVKPGQDLYSIWQSPLECCNRERDLGVYVHGSIKVSTRMDRVVEKAVSMLVFTGMDIESKS